MTGSNNMCLGFESEASAAAISNEITLGNASIATLRCNVTSITALSDARDKKDVEDANIGLDFINDLRPVKFVWDTRDGKKKDIKENEDPYIYKRLVNGLRPLATNPDLEDIEIIKEFELDHFDRDPERMEKCVCGKTELVNLYYMKNRKKMFESDLIDYATSTCIVGKYRYTSQFVIRSQG